ncbi:tetratricopeptide TPR_2 [Reticulomyxa filosa]|uniref:Tetratricopeptide repeat protein 29 n=1 Tax=Reticulomyxa filosa TaxID=46433 RepID=X6M1Z1_RETFI|nr:tetratricopeptide TPR_2 [Reticulomyxa filosa]|eukprot:ETO07417.1 tetratricopeptide TPR_2 [Reticulomyxa filosa]
MKTKALKNNPIKSDLQTGYGDSIPQLTYRQLSRASSVRNRQTNQKTDVNSDTGEESSRESGTTNKDEVEIEQLSQTDRQSLCIDILCEGCVDSFTEFFYLTHRYNENRELHETKFSVDEMIFIKQNLVMAEIAIGKRDIEKAHNAYKNIGDFFRQSNEGQTAIYFYEQCQKELNKAESEFSMEELLLRQQGTTVQTSDTNTDQKKSSFVQLLKELQVVTCLDLGLMYESMKEVDKAIQCYQRHIQIAQQLNNKSQLKSVHRNLIRTLHLRAEELTKNRQYDKALQILQECVNSAQLVKDLISEGTAHASIGNIYQIIKQYQPAIDHHENLVFNDKQGEGAAYFALGKCYDNISDYAVAIKYFEAYMKTANEEKRLEEECGASLALGDVYFQIQQFDKASVELLFTFSEIIPNVSSKIQKASFFLMFHFVSIISRCLCFQKSRDLFVAIKTMYCLCIFFVIIKEYYQVNFELSTKLHDKDRINNARIKLGVAKAQQNMSNFVQAVQEKEINKLLAWKNKRETL